AEELVLSVEAIKTQLRALFEKFEVEPLARDAKRARLVLRALKTAVISRADLRPYRPFPTHPAAPSRPLPPESPEHHPRGGCQRRGWPPSLPPRHGRHYSQTRRRSAQAGLQRDPHQSDQGGQMSAIKAT